MGLKFQKLQLKMEAQTIGLNINRPNETYTNNQSFLSVRVSSIRQRRYHFLFMFAGSPQLHNFPWLHHRALLQFLRLFRIAGAPLAVLPALTSRARLHHSLKPEEMSPCFGNGRRRRTLASLFSAKSGRKTHYSIGNSETPIS